MALMKEQLCVVHLQNHTTQPLEQMPAELLMGHCLQTRLDHLKPDLRNRHYPMTLMLQIVQWKKETQYMSVTSLQVSARTGPILCHVEQENGGVYIVTMITYLPGDHSAEKEQSRTNQ